MSNRIGFVSSATSAGLAAAVAPLLPAGMTLEVLAIDAAQRLVAAGELGVVVLDLDGAPGHDSLRRLTAVAIVGNGQPLSVLGLVPQRDPAGLVAAFDLGAADVAWLPVDPHEVRARLAALVRRRQRADAIAAETRAVWRMAVIDPVTGLYNRYHLDSILPAALDGARAGGRPLALLMIDLDSLKPFNDRWGHAAGDRVLQSVAEALQASVRASDTIARYGGDEIAIIMPDTTADTARALAARLVTVVAQIRIGRRDDGPDGVTVSIGLATLDDRDADARSLLLRADDALYAAKRGGRNRVAEAA